MIRKLFSLIRGDSGEPPDSPGSRAPAGPPKPLSNKPNVEARTPEAMCGIDPKKMNRDEIRQKLAELYKRHNQAAGSLNQELREEAEIMLDAIVACREKHLEG